MIHKDGTERKVNEKAGKRRPQAEVLVDDELRDITGGKSGDNVDEGPWAPPGFGTLY